MIFCINCTEEYCQPTCIVRPELGEKETLGRSLTYKINSKGPRMEPCRTSEETIALEERQEDTEPGDNNQADRCEINSVGGQGYFCVVAYWIWKICVIQSLNPHV